MLGDTTIVDQNTFETSQINAYMKNIADLLIPDDNNNNNNNIGKWSERQIAETRDEDIRRIFAKFETRTTHHHIAIHMSVQFRALLYYRPDAKVIGIQKELEQIDESARKDHDAQASGGDGIIAARLRQMGLVEPDHAKLFEMFYNDESLVEQVTSEIDATARDRGIVEHARRRDELFAELDALLMEVYNTTAVMIDETRLVAGEDGLLYAADISQIVSDPKSGSTSKEGRFEIDTVSKEEQDAIAALLYELLSAVQNASE